MMTYCFTIEIPQKKKLKDLHHKETTSENMNPEDPKTHKTKKVEIHRL
jgi:hypothetical protein